MNNVPEGMGATFISPKDTPLPPFEHDSNVVGVKARNHSELGALKILDPKAFREKVKEAVARNPSQGAAARELGVSLRQLQRYLAGMKRKRTRT